MNHRIQRAPRRKPLTEALVLDCLREAERTSVGRMFVPEAVECTMQRAVVDTHPNTIKRMIYNLAVQGKIELAPESGLNRLTTRELALCPDGPQGTKLSWARWL